MKALPRLHSRQDGQSGFTLIELLVSLTVLAVILGLLGGGLRVLARNTDRNGDRIQTMDMLARAFDILKRDTAGLQRLPIFVARKPRYLFTGTATHLSFVTLEPPYPTPEGPYFVDYTVSRTERRIELVRARAPFERGMTAFPGATPANRVSLIEGAADFRFRYAATTDKGLVWHDHWPFPTRLPQLIRLDVTDARTGQLVSPAFIAAVRADAEIGCLKEGQALCSANPKSELMVKFDADPNAYRLRN
jgi:general secretion pathway protein J